MWQLRARELFGKVDIAKVINEIVGKQNRWKAKVEGDLGCVQKHLSDAAITNCKVKI